MYAGLVLALGVAIGALTRGLTRPAGSLGSAAAAPETGGDGSASGTDYARIVDGLSATLQLEVSERQRLEQQIEAMSDQVGRLERELAEVRGPGTGSDPDIRVVVGDGPLPEETPEPATSEALAPFLEAGFDPARAEYVKQLQDDLQLQRLYVRDQAEREGWIRSPRYRDAMEEIQQREQGLVQDLGEDDYDRYLYSIGRPNRVLVGDVLANGPAQQAGIQVGDAILSYAGERIFEAGSLVNATREGTSGMSTAVEIERDGQTQVVYVPRGPLGINLRVARIRPAG
jgi:hypothetical protein